MITPTETQTANEICDEVLRHAGAIMVLLSKAML
jgi:hypothetical protein